jgi:hypothetical protein
VRALQVLAINTGGAWSVGYILAPEKTSIRAVLDTFATGEETTGWKKIALQMRGMPGMGGASDARDDKWEVTSVPDGRLQSYLDQGSQVVDAQFWVPEQWNPAISKAPASGRPASVAQKLAAAARGFSQEVFLLSVHAPSPSASGTASADGPPPPQDGPGAGGPPGGPPTEAMQKAMAAREEARIARLPADKKAEAQAKFDERKKFFDSLAQLSPEDRQAKMREHMEDEMNGSGPSPMETRMTQFDAMHTVEQRTNFFRRVVRDKQEATGR